MKYLKSLTLSAFTAFLAAQSTFAIDYYWSLVSTSSTGVAPTTANWSSDPNTVTSITGPGYNNTSADVYLMNGISTVGLINVSSALSWNSINNTSTSTGSWTLYSGSSTLSFNSITQNAANTLNIRKTQSGAGIQINAKTVNVALGNLNLGTTAQGYFLKTLVLGDSSNTSGTSVNLTGGQLSIVTTQFENYGTINIAGGKMQFLKGSNYQTSVFTSSNLTITNDINLGTSGTLGYSSDPTSSSTPDFVNNLDGYVSLANVNAVTTTTAGRAKLALFTNAANVTDGSGNITQYAASVGTITLGSAATAEDDRSSISVLAYQDTHISSIVSTNIGGKVTGQDAPSSTSADQGVYIKSYKSGTTVTIGSMNLAVRKFTADSAVVVEGDLTNFFKVVNNTASMFYVNGSNLEIKGNLINNGSIAFDGSGDSGGITNISIGGLSGGLSSSNSRITTSYGTNSTKGTTIITLTGSGNTTYTGRIHDMGSASDPATLTTAALSIVKSGTGNQWLKSYTYYRGDTVINNGKLYITTDNNGKTGVFWGIGRVLLNGGGFGATNRTSSEIGSVTATDFVWSAGNVLVDINGESVDLIKLSGSFTKGAAVLEGQQFTFEFNVTSLEADHAYKIIEWSDISSAADFSESDFLASLTGNTDGLDALTAIFAKQSDGLYVTFSSVPEASQAAAFAGLAALIFAFIRRRRR